MGPAPSPGASPGARVPAAAAMALQTAGASHTGHRADPRPGQGTLVGPREATEGRLRVGPREATGEQGLGLTGCARIFHAWLFIWGYLSIYPSHAPRLAGGVAGGGAADSSTRTPPRHEPMT